MKPILETCFGIAMFAMSFVLVSMTPQKGPASDGIMYKVTQQAKTTGMPLHLSEIIPRQLQHKGQDCVIATSPCAIHGSHTQ